MPVKPIPEGYHSVTPYLVADDPDRVLVFAKEAFGAQEMFRMNGPDGGIAHAEFKIGDSILMLGGASGSERGAMPMTIYLYVEDTDGTYKRALEAGGTSIEEPSDQFYGDRRAGVQDPGGNVWFIATNIEDVSPEEMTKRVEAMQEQS